MRVLLLAPLLASSVWAQTVYSWEDHEGVHFTDDAAQVPRSTRAQRQELALTSTATRPVERRPEAQPAPHVAVPSRPGGMTERDWRDRFIAAHRRITTLTAGVTALREQLATLPPTPLCVSSPPVRAPAPGTSVAPGAPPNALACQPSFISTRLRLELDQREVQLADAKLDLEQLERQASYDAVPREWRRGW